MVFSERYDKLNGVQKITSFKADGGLTEYYLGIALFQQQRLALALRWTDSSSATRSKTKSISTANFIVEHIM